MPNARLKVVPFYSYTMRLMDSHENLKTRWRQLVELGRYARQSVLQWEDVDLVDFFDIYKAFMELTEKESGINTVLENL